MSTRSAPESQPAVVDGEVVDLDTLTPQPLQYPPVLVTCVCGNGTARGHGAVDGRRPFTCREVLAIRASVERHAARSPRGRLARLFRRGGAR